MSTAHLPGCIASVSRPLPTRQPGSSHAGTAAGALLSKDAPRSDEEQAATDVVQRLSFSSPAALPSAPDAAPPAAKAAGAASAAATTTAPEPLWAKSGSLAKEKDTRLAGYSTGWHERFVIVHPGRLRYWESARHAIAAAPPRGAMALDERTALSKTRRPRAGRFAFRLDRGATKMVFAVADAEQVSRLVPTDYTHCPLGLRPTDTTRVHTRAHTLVP